MSSRLNERAQRTALYVRILGGKPTKRKVPKGIPPRLIEREYAKALRGLVKNALVPIVAAGIRAGVQVLPGIKIRFDAGERKAIEDILGIALKQSDGLLPTETLDRAIESFAYRVQNHSKLQTNRQFKAVTGVEPAIRDQRLPQIIEGFVGENVALIKDIPRATAAKIEQAVTRAVSDGIRHEVLATEIRGIAAVSERRAALIARDQVGKLYGNITAARHRELGVDRYIWRTVGDNRVRSSHASRDGNTYSYDRGIKPGEEPLCRCFADPIFDIFQGL